ncbi:MAG: zinc-binding dehydrogenase [Anaerotardibacter sp.]
MDGKMIALVKNAPEPGAMEITELPIPQIKDDEVLMEIKAVGICGTDHSLYKWNEAIANSYNIQYPNAIFGHEFSGVIAELGANAPKNLKVGDRVTANPVLYCNTCSYCDKGQVNICDNRPFYGTDLPGAFAKYMAIRAENIIKMPDEVTFEQGALIEPLCVAINAVDRVNPQMGDTCVVMGPGPIGLLMVAVLKQARGIGKVIVTGLANDAERLKVAESLGAITVNGSECNVIERVLELTGGKGAECIFDAAGHFTVIQQAIEMVAKDGRIGVTGLPAQPSTIPMTPIAMRQITIIGNRAYERKNWRQALNMLANGLDVDFAITGPRPLTDWQTSMDMLDRCEGMRHILIP